MSAAADVVLVTGAASGLGRACAVAQAAAGRVVVGVDVDAGGLTELASEAEQSPGGVVPVVGDVADEGVVVAAVAAARGAGVLVGAVTSAAALGADVFGRDGDVATMDSAVWDRTMEVNLKGTMFVCKHVVPPMIDAGGGAIVTIASGAAFAGTSVRTAYAASKAGVVALTKYVAASYGHRGIRCNCVSPGLVVTPSANANLTADQREAYIGHNLVPRLGVPGDIAEAVAYLLSDRAGFVTGQVLCVDGGLLARQPAFDPTAGEPTPGTSRRERP